MSFEGAGPGARNDIARRATPVVNTDFIVLNIPAAPAAAGLLAVIDAQIALVSAAGALNRPYTRQWKGLLIGANTTAVQILTANGGASVAAGINIPIGQSLYLPYDSDTVATLQYISGAGACSLGIFY